MIISAHMFGAQQSQIPIVDKCILIYRILDYISILKKRKQQSAFENICYRELGTRNRRKIQIIAKPEFLVAQNYVIAILNYLRERILGKTVWHALHKTK